MAGLNVYRGRHRRGGAPAVHDAAAGVGEPFRGEGGPYPPPIDDIEAYWTPAEKAQASSMLTYSVVGSRRDRPARGSARFVELTGVDEVMVVSAIYDHGARVRSYEILAEAAGPGGTAPADEPCGKVTSLM